MSAFGKRSLEAFPKRVLEDDSSPSLMGDMIGLLAGLAKWLVDSSLKIFVVEPSVDCENSFAGDVGGLLAGLANAPFDSESAFCVADCCTSD